MKTKKIERWNITYRLITGEVKRLTVASYKNALVIADALRKRKMEIVAIESMLIDDCSVVRFY